jgi:hypothetical protein
MGPTQPPVTARPGPGRFASNGNDHGGVAHHALPGYPPAPSTAVARRKWSTAGRHRLIRPQCARAIGSSGPDQRSAACPRRFRDRRPPAPERVDDGPPRAAGKDHEARTHTAACTTGPVSHTDGNQPATSRITSFLAISGPCLLGSSLASMGRVECAPECPDKPDRGQY